MTMRQTDQPHDIKDKMPRDTDARQRLATDPDTSVWVSASAGTGKTTVLTRRVLRLLLPRGDGRPGTPAGRILCLTFTKAAASEMKLRLTTTLSQWATLPLESANPHEKSLTGELTTLLGRPPQAHEIIAARRLFAAVVDTPGGLRIMTIHAFCTAILGTFPLEAGLPPQFATLEEAPAAALMTAARNEVLARARRHPQGAEATALDSLAAVLSEEAFNELLQETSRERAQLHAALRGGEAGEAADFLARLLAMLDLPPDADEGSIMMDACRPGAFDVGALRHACAALADGTEKSDQPKGIALQHWLEAAPAQRQEGFAAYNALFLKASDGQPFASQATKGLQARYPACEPALQAEAERLLAVRERLNAAHGARMTAHLFTLAGAVLAVYARMKDERAALDFDDLILRTLKLLKAQDIVPWVMFKLDGGIDHILVDEAQDTNPEQWEIIRLLAADFFTGSGARDDVRRTIFAVGDEKQSIYSFQRAAPEKFAAMRVLFKNMVESAGLAWEDVPLDMSFRTVDPVLRLVDETFAPDAARAGMGSAPLKHYSKRSGHAGLAELWPLFISPQDEKESLWAPPVAAGDSHRAAAHMARHIAATIGQWLDPAHPALLPSQNRPLRPGDIMILVRTRTTFVNQLIRALKVAGIPVGGVDRMVLPEQLAVRDLLAVAQFALLPEDELTLACVLKSPFIGWTDAKLEGLAAYRPDGENLWTTLLAAHPEEAAWLERQRLAAAAHPFEFFSRLLQEQCPASTVSGQHAMTGRLGLDSLDPLEEFLNAALAFETGNIAALQDFILWLNRSAPAIKREQEEAGSSVRIMTVHGSKGLQAPVVILPDTVRPRRGGNRPGERLLWPEKAGLALPLWCPRADRECAPYRQGRQTVQDRMDEEYRRLLYVAMTRAEDRLYIAGFRNARRHIDESWYNTVESAFARMGAQARPAPFAYPPVLDPVGRTVDEAPQIATPQEAVPVDKSAPRHAADDAAAPDPADPALRWLYHPPAPEPLPPQPLIPSRATTDGEDTPEPAALSPLAVAQKNKGARFQRGVLLHRLLQLLPDIPVDRRADTARAWLARNAPDMPPETAMEEAQALLAVIGHPSFAPLFAPGTLAEVPVTGLTPAGRLVSGQIDRLAVRHADREVWIVDYKTNRAPPVDASAIPPLYRRQMEAYAAIVARIYPGYRVRSFLLWTEDARIMEIGASQDAPA